MSQLASHNKFKHNLFRDTSIVVIVTFAVLILSGICGVTLVNVISHSGYKYVASSFGKLFFCNEFIKITSELDKCLKYLINLFFVFQCLVKVTKNEKITCPFLFTFY